jgi:monofunctional biosynthetic peptidoglycan transglycosylase
MASGLRARIARGYHATVKWLGIAVVASILLSAAAVLALRWNAPWTTAFMARERASAVLHGEFRYSNDYEWVDLDNISPHAAIAVIAAEDQQFPFHAGFDFKSIREAIRHNANSRRVRGASTISQQVAKNLFLWSGHSWVRKGLEVWFTVLIESLWPKERILEVYLNVAEFGPGVWGVESASRRYFGKPAARLTRWQSATLAAVLPNPKLMHADRPSAYVASRRDRILGQMRALGGPAYLKQLDNEEPVAASRT